MKSVTVNRHKYRKKTQKFSKHAKKLKDVGLRYWWLENLKMMRMPLKIGGYVMEL